MVIGSNQRLHSFYDVQINTEIDSKLINKVKEAKSLGVIIDGHLSRSNHIVKLSMKMFSATGTVKRITPFISERIALQIYEALIVPRFDYSSSVRGKCNLTLLINFKNFKIGLPGRLPNSKQTAKQQNKQQTVIWFFRSHFLM